jgi:hypothetical protein
MYRLVEERMDDVFGWIAVVLLVAAAIILDRGAPLHKWHAALVWTISTFLGIIIFVREYRGSSVFWIFWAVCLLVHVFAMWALFSVLLPRLIIGTVYTFPLAFVESVILCLVFLRLKRRLRTSDAHLRKRKDAMQRSH